MNPVTSPRRLRWLVILLLGLAATACGTAAPAAEGEAARTVESDEVLCDAVVRLALDRVDDVNTYEALVATITADLSPDAQAFAEELLRADFSFADPVLESEATAFFERAWSFDRETHARCGVPLFTAAFNACAVGGPVALDIVMDGRPITADTPPPDPRQCRDMVHDQLGGLCFVDRSPLDPTSELAEFLPFPLSPFLQVSCIDGERAPHDLAIVFEEYLSPTGPDD